jgi:hypothetical protein
MIGASRMDLRGAQILFFPSFWTAAYLDLLIISFSDFFVLFSLSFYVFSCILAVYYSCALLHFCYMQHYLSKKKRRD